MRAVTLTGLLCVALGGAVPVSAQATQSAQSHTMLLRLDPTVRYKIEVLFDSAARLGLPAELLHSKTLEGISKGATGHRIVEYIRKYFAAMREARATLGPSSTDELAAATGALMAGVERSDFAKLRKSRSGGSIAVPLIILSDLVSRGVPMSDASTAIVQLSQRGALDSEIRGLWLRINQDIVSGVPPAAALQRWTREFPGRAAPGSRIPPGTAPPTAPSPRPPETPSSASP